MIPYILLIFIPAIFSLVAIKKNKRGYSFCVGNNDYIKNNNLGIAAFFLILFILLAFRHETVGRDLRNYKNLFNIYQELNVSSFFSFEPEILFRWLTWSIGQLTDNYQWYLVIIAAITVVPIFYSYNESDNRSFLKIIIFINTTTFLMFFSGLRQAIAMSIGMISYRYVREKRWIAFIVSVFIALGFHHSAFMLFFMYPLYHISFKKKHLWFIVPTVGITFVFNQQIFLALNTMLADYSEEYNAVATETGAVTTLVLFVLFAIVAYMIPDEKTMDKETLGLRNFLLFAVFMQCFASVHPLAMRMNYYFILFIPLLIPKVLSNPAPAYRQVSKLVGVVLSVFFTLYFIYTVYIGSTTGVSALDTYPYVPFWAK